MFTGRVLLGRYRGVRPLARGGMGAVHLGRVEGAQGFAKPVVIKTILANEGENAQLFAREARIVSQLQHPGIVAVIDFGQVDDSHVMVLEYVHGYNLGQWFRYVNRTRNRVPVPQALHILLAVLEALEYAHGLTRPDGTPLGIVHRDISPGNILIDLQGHVKLADFGIARTADDEFRTQAGIFRGTLAFAPPEALQSVGIDARSDQYACAVVLYQMLTGTNPFKGSGTASTVMRILQHDIPRLSTVREDVPPAIDAAVAKAMSRDPANRFATVAEFAEALRHGMTWSERQAEREFAAQILQDFSGNLPEMFGLEPLAARDAAWREAEDAEPSSSTLPVSGRGGPEARTQTSALSGLVATPEAAPSASAAHADELPVTRPSARSWVWLVLAAAIVLSALLLVIFLRPHSEALPPPIIVERQSLTETAAQDALPGPSASVASEASAAPSATPAGTARASKGGAAATRRTLAGAFQQRQGAIQSCFKQNPNAMLNTQLSVRFDVDVSGRVLSASLSPASVAGQPLGACVLGVARSTHFGPQTAPVSFSIPIAARMVQR
ncbi:MAG: protein kinase [Polyangiaceae bacterium]